MSIMATYRGAVLVVATARMLAMTVTTRGQAIWRNRCGSRRLVRSGIWEKPHNRVRDAHFLRVIRMKTVEDDDEHTKDEGGYTRGRQGGSNGQFHWREMKRLICARTDLLRTYEQSNSR